MQIVILKEYDGLLLLQFLRQTLGFSSKLVKHLKYLPNGMTVNGVQRTVRYVLKTGDVLTLATNDTVSADIAPVSLPIEILYEDDDLVVPCKPAGMPTHPSHGHYTDTVANALAFRYRQNGIPFVFRPINRLDRNTSGLLLVARNRPSAGKLSDWMKANKIQKSYLAVLDGEMRETDGIINACLHRTAQSIIVREVCAPDAPDAAPSKTAYRVLSVQNGHTLVEARPITGRTHQLRVHFASIGYPITGDDLYGTASPLIARHALHAYTLSFPHPSSGQRLTLFAPPPKDFSNLTEAYFPQIAGLEKIGKDSL